MANILEKEKKRVYVVSCKSQTKRGGALKEPAGVGYSLQYVEGKIYEYR